MRIAWSNSITVKQPPEVVFAYLADFDRHQEWSGTLESLDVIAPGDENGVGRRFRTKERVDFSESRGVLSRISLRFTGTSECEIRELTPPHRIVWTAHIVPNIGGATLKFDITDSGDGGSIIRQSIDEHHRFPADLVTRYLMGFNESTAHAQFNACLHRLKEVLDTRA